MPCGAKLRRWRRSKPKGENKIMRIDKALLCLTAFLILTFSIKTYAQDSLNITLLGRGLPGECNATFVQDTFAYVGAGDVLMIFNIADAAHPFPVANLPLNGQSQDVIEDLHVSSGRAYIAFDQSGLRIVDVSSPLSPVEIGSLKFNGYAFGVYASGNYAYVCAEYGLHIVDVSSPSSPQEISFFPVQSPWAALNVFVQDTFAYLAAGYGGLYILNVKNPANPVQVSSVDRFGVWVYEVKVEGNWLYMAFSGESGDGFEVFDGTDRANPVGRGSLQTSTSARRIDVYGKFAYLAVADSGFLIIDIRNKDLPSVMGRWNGGYGQNVLFYPDRYGDKVCVSSEYEGFYIVDVTYPDSPVKLSHYDTHSFSQDVTTSPDGRYAYVVEQPSALKVLDLSNPASPHTVFDSIFFPGRNVYGTS